MDRNFRIFCGLLFCGFLILGVISTGCTAEERNQGNVDKNIVLGPKEKSGPYYIIISGSSATDFVLTSDNPVNIDCSDWPDIDKEGVTDFKTRIYTAGIVSRGPQPLPLPGSTFTVVNPDPENTANVHITLTGVKLYN
jgi:hypothetical protein